MIFRVDITFTYSNNPHYDIVINHHSDRYISADSIEEASKIAISEFFDGVLHEYNISKEEFYDRIYPDIEHANGIPSSKYNIALFRLDKTYDFGEKIARCLGSDIDSFCIIQNVYVLNIMGDKNFTIEEHALVGCKHSGDNYWDIDEYPYFYTNGILSVDPLDGYEN